MDHKKGKPSGHHEQKPISHHPTTPPPKNPPATLTHEQMLRLASTSTPGIPFPDSNPVKTYRAEFVIAFACLALIIVFHAYVYSLGEIGESNARAARVRINDERFAIIQSELQSHDGKIDAALHNQNEILARLPAPKGSFIQFDPKPTPLPKKATKPSSGVRYDKIDDFEGEAYKPEPHKGDAFWMENHDRGLPGY